MFLWLNKITTYKQSTHSFSSTKFQVFNWCLETFFKMYRLHSEIWYILVLHIWYINPNVIYLYLHILYTLNNLRKNTSFKKIKAIYFSVEKVTTHKPFWYLFKGPYIRKPLFAKYCLYWSTNSYKNIFFKICSILEKKLSVG